MFTFLNKGKIYLAILKCTKYGDREVLLEKVNFKAARAYAVDNDTESIDPYTKEPNQHHLEIKKEIDGFEYRIIFNRLPNDGTRIQVLLSWERTEAEQELWDKIKKRSSGIVQMKKYTFFLYFTGDPYVYY